MSVTLVQENTEGTRLQLRIEPQQGPKMRIITKNEVEVYYRRYEYWEVDRATRDFWTLVAFMTPGEVRREEAVSGDAAGGAGTAGGDGTGRVLHPRKKQRRGKGAGAQLGAEAVPVGDDHRG
jgi:hypothetical protein